MRVLKMVSVQTIETMVPVTEDTPLKKLEGEDKKMLEETLKSETQAQLGSTGVCKSVTVDAEVVEI